MITSLRVVVMCKAPLIGKVKTRLMNNSHINAQQACHWHRQMAAVVIRRAIHLFPDAVHIASDDPTHPFFTPFAQPLLSQGNGDLGRRMYRIADTMIDHHPLLFLGTDSPHMETDRLLQAVQLAATHDAVAGPVEDGGYDLIILSNRNAMALLDTINWGSDQVWQQTCQRAQQSDLTLASLPLGFDVDNEQDLQRSLQQGWKIS